MLYMQWMVIRMQPQPVWPWPGPGCVSHLGTNHTVRCDWDLLSTSYTYQVHFIHIKGVWHTLYAVDGHKYATSTCMVATRTLAVSHIWSTNYMVMLGYDWGFLSTSYTYQVQFIHIKVVWRTSYDVDGH